MHRDPILGQRPTRAATVPSITLDTTSPLVVIDKSRVTTIISVGLIAIGATLDADAIAARLDSDQAFKGLVEMVMESRIRRVRDLTPQLAKHIVQRMIHDDLGSLVVWGGVFGGAIGLAAAITTSLT